MVLPPLENTPVLMIRFSTKASERLIQLVETKLITSGLLILESRLLEDGRKVITLTTSQEQLEEQAELSHYMKLTLDTNVIEYFNRRQRARFCKAAQSSSSTTTTAATTTNGRGRLSRQPPQQAAASDPRALRRKDVHGLFTPTDWVLLTTRLLNHVTVLEIGEYENDLSRLLETDYHAKYMLRDMGTTTSSASNGSKSFNFKKYNSGSQRWAEHGERSDCLWHVLESYELVDLISPVHLPSIRHELTLQIVLTPWYKLQLPAQDIQSYYGWEVAYYFSWMSFLMQWLTFPGILGLLTSLLRMYRNQSIDEDEITPFYGLVCFVWAILFVRFWERQENTLAYQWGTFAMSSYERQKYFATRAEFRGFVRISPVTGEFETYYPAYMRRLKYVFSALVTMFMLAVAFSVMILSLNVQGYIRPQSNPHRWNDSNPHPFHFSYLATLSEEGQLFDTQSSWRSLIPVVLHVICIQSLNKMYRTIADKLTAYENHETERNHQNSLILKRFLFEAFDCYVALFYLAFYERDVHRLRNELVAIFQIDTLRRLMLECVVPTLLQRLRTGHFTIPVRLDDTGVKTKENIPPTIEDIIEEADMDEYEMFDDYMEICIQIGYVTLFASAYPLASLIAIVSNWIEVRSDAFKLAAACRRPFIFRASGLGMWRTLLSTILWTSALTNCLIAGFTSDQLMYYLPNYYMHTKSGFTDMGHEKGWVLVFVIFGLERLLLVVGLLVYAIVPAVPEELTEHLEHRQHLRVKEQQRLSVLRRRSSVAALGKKQT